ncbi:MAG: hypothetical protein IID32_04490 [Planctomycetes bacterium]|nr:hypothetical protein [Planctomycetota bacterium]
MNDAGLLTQAEATKRLNCSVEELSGRTKKGQIEEVWLRDRTLYRLIDPEAKKPEEVNVALLLDQNKDRGRLIQEMEKRHVLEQKELSAEISRVRRGRLYCVIAVELFIGAMIIGTTVMRDQISEVRGREADMYYGALHQEEQYNDLKGQYDSLSVRIVEQAEALKTARLSRAQLEAELVIQDVKMAHARNKISQLAGQL